MSERHHELTPSLKRALESWFEDYLQHINEMAPIRRVIEERERNVKREERINAKREYLILLLESKFGPLSEEFVSRLESVRDVNELNRLYKRALVAQTLEEIEFQESKKA